MKKILFLTLALALCANTAFAAQDIPPGYPPAIDGIGGVDGGKPCRKLTISAPRSCR